MHANWYSFLLSQSAVIEEGVVTAFANDLKESNNLEEQDSLYDLSQLDVLKISGSDASDFLHGQFTSDVAALSEGEYQLSSWCNIKGRIIAVFILYRAENCFYLLLERELTEQVSKRLSMFVLRSEVKIELLSDELVRLGISGKNVHDNFQQPPGMESQDGPGIMLQFPGPRPRSLFLCTAEQAETLWQQLSPLAHPVSSMQWLQQDIRAGIPWPGKQGSEEFLPQSLNLDLLGGLSYNKGCYPGQEIISRMHFRGKLKQRMQIAMVSSEMAPQTGTHIYTQESDKQCGTVVRSSSGDENKFFMLITLDLFESVIPGLFLGNKEGPEIELLDLPYDLKTGT